MTWTRDFFRKYSEIYTVFLPLFSIFLIVYGILISTQHPVIAPYDPSKDELLDLHRNLIDIPSVTLSENDVASYLGTYLADRGFTVERQQISTDPARENIYAYKGITRDTKVLLTSHIDTVPPFIPYSYHDGYIWGRGSVDAKASVAAQVTAAIELLADGQVQEGDVSLLYVVGEETDGIGMTTASESLNANWEAAVFGEPTELKLAVGHKGILLADLYAHGKASHSGYPELGINANSYIIEALYKLDNLKYPSSELLGNTTFNIGTLQGGVAANVIPANASAGITVRVADDLPQVVRLMKDAVEDVDHVELDITLTYEPVYCDYDVPGFDTIVASYGTDIPHLKADIKKYLYGPGSILVAHAENERLSEADLRESVVGYKKLVAFSLGKSLEFHSTTTETKLVAQ
ncbi:hypothetical protein V1514DRAFT_168165 [Lipomyces japonicus]|uniref:uncharacterized protein n=1 Tax=Lipomyces japonicus TaxID=56871 RepID=UPI0034CD9A6E